MVRSDVFVFLDNVEFSKGSYTNRTQIRSGDDKRWLTVPVKTAGKLSQNIMNVECQPNCNVINVIAAEYKKSEYYGNYSDLLNTLNTIMGLGNLCELNICLIKSIFNMLGFSTNLVRASELGITGSSTQLLISICKSVGADRYLSGSGGKNYQDINLFANAGIEVSYNNFKHPTYTQHHGGFIPGLSIIDMLMNEGVERTAEVLND